MLKKALACAALVAAATALGTVPAAAHGTDDDKKCNSTCQAGFFGADWRGGSFHGLEHDSGDRVFSGDFYEGSVIGARW
ncbi:hypothetical protein [Streptomyces sp. NPDC051310]|uniref:hypothetical protein n=1 Tax=Streptomyces sp. NPDC051310 TaxID=3365649 RepID=UPI0037B46CD1